MLGISDAAESIGFNTQGVRLTLERLIEDMPLPCILHWNQNHFVVCYEIIKKGNKHCFMISDPAYGKYKIDEQGFCKCWCSTKENDEMVGIALALSPSPEFYEHKDGNINANRGIGYFFRYLFPYKLQLLQLVIGIILGSVFSLILPFLTQAVVDQGINNDNMSLITLILVAQLILSVTQTGVNFLQSWITLHMNTRISITLISDFLMKLMKLPLNFFDSKNIGDIMQRIGDHSRIQTFMTGNTLSTVFSLFNFIVFSFILVYYDVQILFVFIVGNTLYVLWIIFFMRYRRRLDNARFTQSSINQSNMVQMITGMQEIKLNNCEKLHRWLWESIQVKLFKINIKSMALGQCQQIGSIFFSHTTGLLISYISAKSVLEGEMTLGMMMSVSYIIGQLSAPVGQVIGFAQSLQDAKISLERLNEIHNKEDEDKNWEEYINEIPLNENLVFDGVSFSYDGSDREYILQNINIEIPRHKVTAIVGASGSGKTTIIKLLLGFYIPNIGSIKIGNLNLKDINPHLWRHKAGAVMQEGFIFSDTIARNIALKSDNIDKERLYYAVEAACIRDFIESLPLKYNTRIGMDGSGISQGQKQRILIARAIYKNPEFIFFDEATNALDANNERIIMNNLNEFYKGRTVVVVAHRLSTVQNADNIIVLDNGTVVEEGTHKELSELKGAYYNLVKNQLELGV